MNRNRVAGPAVILTAVLALMVPAASADEPAGIVVAGTSPESVAARKGLRAGDRLLRWEQGDAAGSFESPFDLAEVELERAPRGEVRVHGLRDDLPLAVVLFPDDWGLEVRPHLPDPAISAFEAAQRQLSQGDTDGALASLIDLAQQPSLASRQDARLWVVWEELRGAADAGRLDRARAAGERGAQQARREHRPRVQAQFLVQLAAVLEEWGRLEEADTLLTEALAIRRALEPGSLAVAAVLTQRSRVALALARDPAQARIDLAEAAAAYDRLAPESLARAALLDVLASSLPTTSDMMQTLERALTLKEALAPEGLAVAETLFRLTDYTYDVKQRLERAQRAQAIRHRLAAGTLDEAASLSNLGDALRRLGDTRAAEEHERQALAIRELRRPGSLQVADSLKSLGSLLHFRGDFVRAEQAILRAIEICEKVAPEAELLGRLLNNLGYLRRMQGDFAAAEVPLNRALSAQGWQGKDVLGGVLLINLGDVAFEQGNLSLARQRFQQADAIIRAIDPERPVLSYLQRRLGQLLFALGDLAEAEKLYQAALAKDEERYPRSITRSELHHALGELALRRGDLDAAERSHRTALALREELAPGSLWEAESCHSLAVLCRRRGQTDEALGLLRRAAGALEVQVRNLGTSPEVRARFRARHQAIFRDLEELLVEMGRADEAFGAMESSRSRALLALLKARDLEFAAVPEPLERERRLADAEYDGALVRLGSTPSADSPQRARVLQELEVARRRQDEARARIRVAAPRLAAVRDPQPLDLAGVRRALAPGTLLLAYSLGAETSRLYALGPGPQDFAVARLPVGEAALREEVRSFRESIQARRGRLRRRDLLDRSRRLGEILLSPVTAQLAGAERVLIAPDGALHALPFGALGLPAPGRSHRFLVQAKPLHTVSSVTLYAELVRPRDAGSRPREVVGFGDPHYARSQVDAGPAALRGDLRSGRRLEPLPWTRSELQALGLAASNKPQLWLGAEATEERAKALGPEHRIIHFACHGLLDEVFPLESGLALSTPGASKPGAENGLFQAWEIFENLRIDADLVTLSACQTALGKEVAGEGLMGLSWAFQYAGARSVLASLWEVSDASTADLMRHFYRQVGSGVSKAEALRRAQLELLNHPATSAPFYWAAFELIGDWR